MQEICTSGLQEMNTNLLWTAGYLWNLMPSHKYNATTYHYDLVPDLSFLTFFLTLIDSNLISCISLMDNMSCLAICYWIFSPSCAVALFGEKWETDNKNGFLLCISQVSNPHFQRRKRFFFLFSSFLLFLWQFNWLNSSIFLNNYTDLGFPEICLSRSLMDSFIFGLAT